MQALLKYLKQEHTTKVHKTNKIQVSKNKQKSHVRHVRDRADVIKQRQTEITRVNKTYVGGGKAMLDTDSPIASECKERTVELLHSDGCWLFHNSLK